MVQDGEVGQGEGGGLLVVSLLLGAAGGVDGAQGGEVGRGGHGQVHQVRAQGEQAGLDLLGLHAGGGVHFAEDLAQGEPSWA